jgi:hypothetical protein
VRKAIIPLREASVAPLAALTTLEITNAARASLTALLLCSSIVHALEGHDEGDGAGAALGAANVVCTLISHPLVPA